MNLKEIIATMLMPTIKEIGKLELNEIFAKMEAKETAENFAADLKTINATFTRILAYAKQTKTKIDDGIVETILSSVQETAAASGIVL